MRTDDLIVELVRSAAPVRPLAAPSIRFTRWAVAMMVLAVAGVLLLGPRTDLFTALRQPAYAARLIATLLTSLLAGSAAFVLSVPGAERSAVQRILPFLAMGAWAVLLALFLLAGGNAVTRVLAFPVNWPCGFKIFGFSLIPAVGIFALLRRAAPLQPVWAATLGALSATALGAVATQFICPVDDPAHQLVGHVLPVAVLTVFGMFPGQRSLDWFRRNLVVRPG